MAEVAGGAAVLVDPLRRRVDRAGIERAIARRASCGRAGSSARGAFSWAESARRTLDAVRVRLAMERSRSS